MDPQPSRFLLLGPLKETRNHMKVVVFPILGTTPRLPCFPPLGDGSRSKRVKRGKPPIELSPQNALQAVLGFRRGSGRLFFPPHVGGLVRKSIWVCPNRALDPKWRVSCKQLFFLFFSRTYLVCCWIDNAFSIEKNN